MSRSNLLVVTGLVLVPFAPLAALSCANADDEADVPVRPSALPEASGDASTEASTDPSDGGCDASDPNCPERALTCDEASWCPSESATSEVSKLYALTKVWGSGKDDVWVVGSGGTVVHWNGSTWAAAPVPGNPLPIRNTFYGIWGSGPNDVWIASSSETIFRNTGSGWVKQPSPFDRETEGESPITAIWGDGDGRLRLGTDSFAYIQNGRFLLGNQLSTRTDGTISWARHAGTATITGFFGSANDLWLIGDNSAFNGWQYGLTQHGTASGDAGAGDDELVFTDVECHAVVKLHAIWGASASDVWTVGDQGTIRRMRAGMTEWEVVPPITKENLHAIWGASASDVWVAGENGTILHYDGTSWTADTAAFPAGKKKPALTGIWGSGPDDVWIVGGPLALHYTGKKAGEKP